MEQVNIPDVMPNDRNKVTEVKVYRKWINRNPPNPTPTGYCCILLDKLGHVIQANMDFNDMEYFDHLLQQDSAFKISNFLCDPIKSWQQTLPNHITIRFGRFTRFENTQNEGFPNHHFRFLSYNQLFRRLPKNSIISDYIACIQGVGDLKELGDPNRNQIIKRPIDLINLNGNTDEMAINFDEEAYNLMEKPVILAVSSCWVTKFGELLQLSATPATHYYMNPNIPEVEQSHDEYKSKYILNPSLKIDKQRFTCEGTIVDITAREWCYTTCTMCNKKLTNGTSALQCRDHGPQPEPNYRGSTEFIFDDILDQNLPPIKSFEPVILASSTTKTTNTLIEKKHVISTTHETEETEDEEYGTDQIQGIGMSTPLPYCSQTDSSTSQVPQTATKSAKRMLFPKNDEPTRTFETKKKKIDNTTTKEKEE